MEPSRDEIIQKFKKGKVQKLELLQNSSVLGYERVHDGRNKFQSSVSSLTSVVLKLLVPSLEPT
jgi:hypothetical protein